MLRGCLNCGTACYFVGQISIELKPYRVVLIDHVCGHRLGFIFEKDDQYALCLECNCANLATRVLDERVSEFIRGLYE